MATQFLKPSHQLRLIGILALWITCACTLQAQQFTYKLTSSPDSANVSINGISVGKTPVEAKIDWSQSPTGGFEFVFSRPGYKDVKYMVTEKPRYKENFKDVTMEKIRPHFDLEPGSALVDFDKVMAEFPLGKLIGRNKTFYGGDITWAAYSRVGVQDFEVRANDVLGSAGFRTPSIQKNELFSEEIVQDTNARYIIGGKLTDIWVELGPTVLIGIKAKNWCTIEWKVFDKVLQKVVLTEVSKGEFDGKYTDPTERGVMLDLFQDAMENFLHSGTLYSLVKDAN